jgi:hypothetical protein
MKTILTASFIAVFALLVMSCNHGSQKTDKTIVKAAIADSTGDSVALTKLVQAFYKWQETKGKGSDFDPKNIAGDSLFRGIDWDAHNKRVKTLQESNFLDQHFFNNYQQIAQYLDTALKSGREQWVKDELPSFGYDGNPWCNCQDSPVDNYWEILKLVNLKIENNHADFAWTWGDGFMYRTKAIKENGTWKISYLEGFRPDNFKSNQ